MLGLFIESFEVTLKGVEIAAEFETSCKPVRVGLIRQQSGNRRVVQRVQRLPSLAIILRIEEETYRNIRDASHRMLYLLVQRGYGC